jgi:tetratricopeptide (TPR) repeat protein
MPSGNFHLLRNLAALVAAVLAAVAPPTLAGESDIDAWAVQARTAEKHFDSRTALELYRRIDTARPNDAAVLQKISQQYSDLTAETSDVSEKKHLCVEALSYAERAVALQPKNPVNVLSLAICYGKLAGYSDLRTKLEYSKRVQRYAEEALQLDPNYDYANHVLGRWNYEVASLGPGTRFLVKLIYGGLPPASTAEAVRYLRRAVELSPQLPSHRVELGFALLADGQTAAAKATFEAALAMPQREKYDEESFKRAREALNRIPQ